jgi:hypothetical protein
MAPQRVPFRHQRVVEIVGWISRHTELSHHPLRVGIAWRGDRHDLFEPEAVEPESQRGGTCLGRVAPAPEAFGQTPSDLDPGVKCAE